MTWNNLNVLAVVPARGGSKSIPRKNLKQVGGMSLLARAARVINSLDWIDAAIISTDDEEIAEEARNHGLDVPFMRPAELSGDTANSMDMWSHAWNSCEQYYDKRFELSILLEPTSPLRHPQDIELTIRTLIEGDHRAAATVSPTPAHYTPHKTLTIDSDGIVGFYLQDGQKYSIRQGIPDYYHRNGICYAVTRQTLLQDRHILEDDCAAVIIERPVVNIDEPFDLELTEWLLSRE